MRQGEDLAQSLLLPLPASPIALCVISSRLQRAGCKSDCQRICTTGAVVYWELSCRP